MTHVRPLVATAVLAALLAGCVDAPAATNVDATMDHHHEVVVWRPFSFTAENCYEAGFQAVYIGGPQTYAKTWLTTDIKKEYGDPMFDSFAPVQRPVVGDTYANVHNGFHCETAVFENQTFHDVLFGWVGDPIKPPAFDPGGADFEAILSFIAMGNGTMWDALNHSTNARISQVWDSSITYLSGKITDEKFRVHEQFRLVENGVYEGISDMTKYRDVGPRTIRLWWTVPADGTKSHIGAHEGGDEHPETAGIKWNPIYWDIKTSGGTQWTTPRNNLNPSGAAGQNWGCHGGVDDHGGGKACQPVQTSIYFHKSLTFTMGPVNHDVVIDQYWFH